MSKTTQKYSINGATVMPFKQQEGSVVDHVPAGYYQVKHHPFAGFYLQKVSDRVDVPDQIFGTSEAKAQRILETYSATTSPMGVGLFGKKGAGKSLLSAVIANKSIDNGIPVIDVSDSFNTNSEYLNFINSIQECTVIFDEFLKHLSKMSTDSDDNNGKNSAEVARNRQDEMLTFFQGANNNKRLILLIDNSSYMLSEFFTDRPGRMRYVYQFAGVEREVIEQLGEHYNLPESKIDNLLVYSKRYSVSFDVINEIIREWVMYPDESLDDLTEILNVPTLRPEITYKGRVTAFKTEESDIKLASELCHINSDGSVYVDVTLKSEVYGEREFKTSEEYYESDICNKCEYTFDDYKERRLVERYTTRIGVANRSIVGIKGNSTTYQYVNDVYITVEQLEFNSVNQSNNWNQMF